MRDGEIDPAADARHGARIFVTACAVVFVVIAACVIYFVVRLLT